MMLHNEIHYAVNRKCAVASQCVGGGGGGKGGPHQGVL